MANRFILLLLIPCYLTAQQTVDVGKDNGLTGNGIILNVVGGTPFSSYKYVKVVSGSPYFSEDWMKAVAVLANKSRARSNQVRLDLLSGDVIYKDSTNQEFIAVTPMLRLSLTDPSTGKEYNFVNITAVSPVRNKLTDGWCLELEAGTATLYKRIKKIISESRAYNSATTEQSINEQASYIIEISNELFVVKRPKDLPAILSDKKIELENFIAANNINGRTDKDFISVVAKYNELAVTK